MNNGDRLGAIRTLAGIARLRPAYFLSSEFRGRLFLPHNHETASRSRRRSKSSGAAQLRSLKLSIALLAYNRERFLTKQLESILAQSRLPDELIIGDDCSTDRTAEIISEFCSACTLSCALVR